MPDMIKAGISGQIDQYLSEQKTIILQKLDNLKKEPQKITLTKEKPIGLWEKLAPKEYGFWANVNPNVSHPRWSQSKEQLLGTNVFQKTQIYNGYEENVSYMYSNLSKQEKLKLFR